MTLSRLARWQILRFNALRHRPRPWSSVMAREAAFLLAAALIGALCVLAWTKP